MRDPLRVALIGCGRIAKRHATLLAAGHVQGLQLVAVCDEVPERAESFAAEHGVEAFTDMDEMMERAHPDIVSILTPSGLHAQHALRLAPHGAHLVVEKPMALNIEDAEAMIEACDRHRCRLFVVKQNRFNVPVLKLREALDEGRFGRLIMGSVRVRWCRHQHYYDQDEWRGTWAFDGGVLANQASHHIDLLQWVFGDVESVAAMGTTALADIETEDTAAVILRFRSGALGVIEATTATRPKDLEGSVSVLGERGTVEIGGFAVNQMKTWMFEETMPGDEEVFDKYSVNPPDVYGYGHTAYYEHVLDCITNGRPQLVDGLEGRRSLELITAIYEAIETGRQVHLRFRPRLSRLGRAATGGESGPRVVVREVAPGSAPREVPHARP